uniref:Cytosolic carboxypeptidase 2 n=1 Tax=Magallana gigas TaxID=29159 RepID=K1QKD8_MAGGI
MKLDSQKMISGEKRISRPRTSQSARSRIKGPIYQEEDPTRNRQLLPIAEASRPKKSADSDQEEPGEGQGEGSYESEEYEEDFRILTGRNQGFRHNFSSYAEWEKTYGYQLSSGSGSESDDSDLDSDEKKNAGRKMYNNDIFSIKGKKETLESLPAVAKEKTKEQENNCTASSEEDDNYYMLWQFLDSSEILDHFDFFKNADNKLQEELLRTTQLVYSYKDGKGMVPKLREPRNLYALAKELGPQQAARWPADIQVLDEKVKHIRYIPPDPELFYKPTGCEKTPMVRGEENGGRLVYMYEPRSTFFVRSRVGGLRSGPQKCNIELQSEEDDTLIFESRFESGNLAKAVQVNSTDYELWLRYDLYTNKHTQWFYFRVSNTRANKTYRFTIVNFMKSDSLYNDGMKPLIYSEKNAQQKKVGWVRGGSDIKYYKNNLRYSTSKSDKSFYSLTWTVKLEHNHDTVYFAHCFPYTYTDLQDYLLDLSNDPVKNKICKQRVLCRTLAGNLVYLLSITSPTQNSEDMKHKKAVVITSRVHPGECNSSWMMKGFLDYLTGNSADAKLLRDTFIFKIVPMLNPDGVIVGNYRCSLAGRDLNRNYKTVLKDSYPSVWHTKNMIRKLLQEREIIVYCDLHGHSRKQNVFIYGCENRHNPEKRLKERVFPLMLNKNAPDKFKFESCKFKVQKSKEGTGRIVMWNMGIMNSYTMEATFCGSTMGKKKGYHFSMADFEALGYHFCDTLLDYCDPDNTKSCNILLEIEERLKREIMVKLQKAASTSMPDINDINLSDYSSEDVESSDGGSDSSVSDGPPVHLQFTASRPTKKKKKLKTKKERDRVRSLKDEPKKPAAADRPVSDPHACEKKPILTGHQQAHAKQEKLSSPSGGMKYTLAVKRPKSSEEHATQPIINDEKSEQRARRAYTTLFDPRDHSDYLEALTNAYLRNGLLTQDQAAPHFRYSGNKVSPTIPFNLEGLCPHHEQTFAAQYMAQQIQNINSGVVAPEVSLTHTPDLRMTDSVVTSMAYSGPFDALVTPQLLLKGGQQAGADPTIDEIVRSQISHQASIPMSRQPTQRHILEVSAAQQRQQDVLTQARRHQPAYPVTGRLCYRHKLAIRRDQINPNLVLIQDSLTHTFILQGDKSGNSIRQHPNPFDEQYTHAKNSRPRAHVPETSFNNYEPLDNHKKPPPPPEEHLAPSQGDATEETTAKEEPVMEEEEEIDHRKHGHKGKHKEKGGRKSRMGMRESDDDPGPSTEGPDYLQDPHHHNGPRVKSAKGGKEMDSVVESIKELRQSLANNAMQQNHLSPTTGLMRETGEEIEELTNEIRHDIEQEHRLAKDRDKQKAKEIKKFQSLDDYKMNENRNSNSQALSIGNKSKTVLTREPPGNGFDDKRPFNARYKSKSVTNYPISDRTHDRNQKWRDPSLMITGDTSLNYSNTYITNARKSTSETVYTIPASSANATHVNSSGASVYRNSLNLNTTSTATQTSSKMEKAFPRVELYPDTDHPIRLADANGYAMTNTKSKSAKDLRDGITNVITGKEDRKSDKYFEQHQNRVRSAKSGRQSVGKQSVTPSSLTEAVPTKIQLMISQDHQEEKAFGGQFLPLSRTIRAPFYRNNSKRK